MKKIAVISLSVFLACFIAVIATLKLVPSFGGEMLGERLDRIVSSEHYFDGAFFNEERQSSQKMTWDFVHEQFFGEQIRVPPAPLPVIPIGVDMLANQPESGLRVIWIGHAGTLIEIDGVRLLIDPVFSDYASPFQFIGPKRFHAAPIALQDLQGIHAVVISHDHYDHLDMDTVVHLASQGTQFFVPLGIGAHLQRWHIPAAQINELEWWQEKSFRNLTIVSTPNRHYSGRGLSDYKATLWSSWSILGPQHRVFYSGDTGYSKLFSHIGEKFGPFDLDILKIGSYGPTQSWIDIHMTPEDAVKVHLDLKGKRLLPVHWATFNLGLHDWDEPIKRALDAANAEGVDIVTPRIGEVVTVGQPFDSTKWWEAIK